MLLQPLLPFLILIPVAMAIGFFFLRVLSGMGKYQEFNYTPAELQEFSAADQRYIQDMSPYFRDASFKVLGDFNLCGPPARRSARFFLSDLDPHTLGAIESCQSLFYRARTFSFMTVFEDGVLIESADLKAPSMVPPADSLLKFQFLKGHDFTDVLERHQERVSQHLEESGTKALVVNAANFSEQVEYGRQLAHWVAQQQISQILNAQSR